MKKCLLLVVCVMFEGYAFTRFSIKMPYLVKLPEANQVTADFARMTQGSKIPLLSCREEALNAFKAARSKEKSYYNSIIDVYKAVRLCRNTNIITRGTNQLRQDVIALFKR